MHQPVAAGSVDRGAPTQAGEREADAEGDPLGCAELGGDRVVERSAVVIEATPPPPDEDAVAAIERAAADLGVVSAAAPAAAFPRERERSDASIELMGWSR